MMYMHDLSTPVPLYKYVDERTQFDIILCEMNSISLMQESVNIAAEWTNNNDMQINSEKSKELLISYARGIGNEVPNILEGKVVERVDPVQLFGYTLSNDLTWKSHVDNIIVNYAGKRICILYQLKRAGIHQVTRSPSPFTKLTWSRYSLYISVPRPTVEYAWPVWHANLPI